MKRKLEKEENPLTSNDNININFPSRTSTIPKTKKRKLNMISFRRELMSYLPRKILKNLFLYGFSKVSIWNDGDIKSHDDPIIEDFIDEILNDPLDSFTDDFVNDIFEPVIKDENLKLFFQGIIHKNVKDELVRGLNITDFEKLKNIVNVYYEDEEKPCQKDEVIDWIASYAVKMKSVHCNKKNRKIERLNLNECSSCFAIFYFCNGELSLSKDIMLEIFSYFDYYELFTERMKLLNNIAMVNSDFYLVSLESIGFHVKNFILNCKNLYSYPLVVLNSLKTVEINSDLMSTEDLKYIVKNIKTIKTISLYYNPSVFLNSLTLVEDSCLPVNQIEFRCHYENGRYIHFPLLKFLPKLTEFKFYYNNFLELEIPDSVTNSVKSLIIDNPEWSDIYYTKITSKYKELNLLKISNMNTKSKTITFRFSLLKDLKKIRNLSISSCFKFNIEDYVMKNDYNCESFVYLKYLYIDFPQVREKDVIEKLMCEVIPNLFKYLNHFVLKFGENIDSYLFNNVNHYKNFVNSLEFLETFEVYFTIKKKKLSFINEIDNLFLKFDIQKMGKSFKQLKISIKFQEIFIFNKNNHNNINMKRNRYFFTENVFDNVEIDRICKTVKNIIIGRNKNKNKMIFQIFTENDGKNYIWEIDNYNSLLCKTNHLKFWINKKRMEFI